MVGNPVIHTNITQVVDPGRTWASVVKNDPPKINFQEKVVEAKAEATDDDEFASDYKGLTFTNTQFQGVEDVLSREGLATLLQTVPARASQEVNSEEIISDEKASSVEVDTNDNASHQSPYDKTLHLLTNMLKKDIGLPLSIPTTTVSTQALGELKSSESFNIDSKESPVVFLDHYNQSDWSNGLNTSRNFSFEEIQGTVEFVDPKDKSWNLSQVDKSETFARNELSFAFDSYSNQPSSLSGIVCNSLASAPAPEPFGFAPVCTVIDIPPTKVSCVIDERRSINVHPWLGSLNLSFVNGEGIHFNEQDYSQSNEKMAKFQNKSIATVSHEKNPICSNPPDNNSFVPPGIPITTNQMPAQTQFFSPIADARQPAYQYYVNNPVVNETNAVNNIPPGLVSRPVQAMPAVSMAPFQQAAIPVGSMRPYYQDAQSGENVMHNMNNFVSVSQPGINMYYTQLQRQQGQLANMRPSTVHPYYPQNYTTYANTAASNVPTSASMANGPSGTMNVQQAMKSDRDDKTGSNAYDYYHQSGNSY